MLPTKLDPSSTLLFLGSGFTSEATNIQNASPPVGSGLAKEFERQLGIESGELDLKTLATEMNFRTDKSLYQTLYNLFTIAALSASQAEILSRKWLRIFTTNYDDAIELAYALRLLLQLEENDDSNEVSRFDAIMEKSELVLTMIANENRRGHAIQVLDGFEPFVHARGRAMSRVERNALILQIGRLEKSLESLSAELRAELGSESIRKSLARARTHIVQLPY